MNVYSSSRIIPAGLCLFAGLVTVACSSGKADPRAEAPPKAVVEPDLDAGNFKVDHPDRFPLAVAVAHKAPPALNVTGVVQPDIVRAVPVVSLASGRVVEIKARLGDAVKKGQLCSDSLRKRRRCQERSGASRSSRGRYASQPQRSDRTTSPVRDR